MRKENPLDPLLTRPVQGVLAATLMHPEREWYLADLARHLDCAPSSLQRPLAGLVDAGILKRREDGNRVLYQADPRCPFHPELRGLVVKTVGLVDVLRKALEPLRKRIRLAFVFGSIASGEELSTSDVDLMVVGSVGYQHLHAALDKAEFELGRPVNPCLYTQTEFEKKLLERNQFVVSVVGGAKLGIIGEDSLLEHAAGSRTARPPPDES